MKKVFFGILMLFALSSIAQVQVPFNGTKPFTAEIVKFTDGDTFKVKSFEDGKIYTIRLAGADAPEKRQEFGKDALYQVIKILNEFNNIVTIQIIAKDFYGRYVSWVYYGKESNYNLTETLIRDGFAWHYKEFDNSKLLQECEDKARANKNGLWQFENPIYPSDFRKTKKRI